MRWRSTCWVYASDLKDKGIFEKYSWAVLKSLVGDHRDRRAFPACTSSAVLPDAWRFAELESLSLIFGLPVHARRMLLQHGALYNFCLSNGQYWLASRHGNAHVDELWTACF